MYRQPSPQSEVANDQTLGADYGLSCHRCGKHWVGHYGVRRHRRSDGQIVRLFYRDGALVPSPWTLVECPRCGDDWVRISSIRGSGEAAG